MTTRSLLRILLLLGVVWLMLMTLNLLSLRSIWLHADGYFRVEYLVTEGDCSTGGGESGPCCLEGKVLLDRGQTGRDEALCSGTSVTYRAGALIDVFYNPTVSDRVERLLYAYGADDVKQLVRRRLWQNARLLLLVLGSAALVHVLLRTGPGRVARRPRQLVIDLGGVASDIGPALGATPAAIGIVLFSHGLTFIAWGISPLQIGGIVLGLVLAAAGTPLLVRRFLVLVEDEGKAFRGWHFLGLPFRRRQESLPHFTQVGLRRTASGGFVVFLAGPEDSERVDVFRSFGPARDRARHLASLLGVPLENATAASLAPPGT
jgi:hypothetical protein